MKVYKIPISWQSYRVYNVEAENLERAIYQSLKQFLSEPDDEYLQDSFEIDGVVEDFYPNEEYDFNKIMQSL